MPHEGEEFGVCADPQCTGSVYLDVVEASVELDGLQELEGAGLDVALVDVDAFADAGADVDFGAVGADVDAVGVGEALGDAAHAFAVVVKDEALGEAQKVLHGAAKSAAVAVVVCGVECVGSDCDDVVGVMHHGVLYCLAVVEFVLLEVEDLDGVFAFGVADDEEGGAALRSDPEADAVGAKVAFEVLGEIAQSGFGICQGVSEDVTAHAVFVSELRTPLIGGDKGHPGLGMDGDILRTEHTWDACAFASKVRLELLELACVMAGLEPKAEDGYHDDAEDEQELVTCFHLFPSGPWERRLVCDARGALQGPTGGICNALEMQYPEASCRECQAPVVLFRCSGFAAFCRS